MNDCLHSRNEVRRMVTNGTTQLRRQCIDCGEAISAALKYADFPGWQSLPESDEEARERGYRERAERARFNWEQARAEEDARWMAGYRAYLESPEWRRKRLRVFVERRAICEGCRKDLLDGTTTFPPAFEVHHVAGLGAYRMREEGFGGELLYQLVLLCPACHRKIPTRFAERATA